MRELPVNDSTPILQLRGITKSFAGITVLHDIDLDLYPGEVHCIVGENGAGKSTLIKIISGAYHRDRGELVYQGEALEEFSPGWAREQGINTIYQEIDLVPSLTAAENIFLGIEPTGPLGGINWRALRQLARQQLDDLGVSVPENVPVGKLKIAQQQMVAIAKALTLKSKVIILDEPTAVFTSSEIQILFAIIRRLKAQGIAIVYISHHLDEIFAIGDRVTVLRDGELIRTERVDETNKANLVRAMVGRDIDFSQRNGRSRGEEVVLRVEHLSAPGLVEDINFEVHCGEIVGIAGLVGAGRTDLVQMIIGAEAYTRGAIYLNGGKIRPHSPKHALDIGIGMIPENRKQDGLVLVRSMSENMAYSVVQARAKRALVPWRSIRAYVGDLIKMLAVRPENPQLQVHFLSGGNQQKVVLGKWLAADCGLLIMDEPTRGVDVGARSEIYTFMQQLKQNGKAILMVSSDMTEILTQADRILVMARGRIVGELDGKQATEEQVLSLAIGFDETMETTEVQKGSSDASSD